MFSAPGILLKDIFACRSIHENMNFFEAFLGIKVLDKLFKHQKPSRRATDFGDRGPRIDYRHEDYDNDGFDLNDDSYVDDYDIHTRHSSGLGSAGNNFRFGDDNYRDSRSGYSYNDDREDDW